MAPTYRIEFISNLKGWHGGTPSISGLAPTSSLTRRRWVRDPFKQTRRRWVKHSVVKLPVARKHRRHPAICNLIMYYLVVSRLGGRSRMNDVRLARRHAPRR